MHDGGTELCTNSLADECQNCLSDLNLIAVCKHSFGNSRSIHKGMIGAVFVSKDIAARFID